MSREIEKLDLLLDYFRKSNDGFKWSISNSTLRIGVAENNYCVVEVNRDKYLIYQISNDCVISICDNIDSAVTTIINYTLV